MTEDQQKGGACDTCNVGFHDTPTESKTRTCLSCLAKKDIDAKLGKTIRDLCCENSGGQPWSSINNIRFDLINRKFNVGLTEKESQTLESLQKLSYSVRHTVMPLPKI